MATLWPESNDTTLIMSITNYLKDILKNKTSLIDDNIKESLGIACDCLDSINNTVKSSNDATTTSISLIDIYNDYLKHLNEKKPSTMNDISMEDKKNDENTDTNNDNRHEKFKEFVKVLQTKNFFNEYKEGSEEYNQRLEKALKQWNQRFPDLAINNLDEVYKNENIASRKTVSADDIRKADLLKEEGNNKLNKKDIQGAVDCYSQAISLNPYNVVYYSNRSAAYSHLKQYKNAADDAHKAIALDKEFVKAYVRLAVAEFENGNYEGAQQAYQEALNRTPPSDPNWETYTDRIEICKQKLNIKINSVNENQPNFDFSQMGNLFSQMGGQQGMQNLLSGMGGMEGLSKLMENPMMQQMAQKMMSDPSKMSQLSQMMNDPQLMNSFNDILGSNPTEQNDTKATMQQLLQNPEKTQQVLKNLVDDEEYKKAMQNPEYASVLSKLKNGDYSALTQIAQKPDLMNIIKRLVNKYMKN